MVQRCQGTKVQRYEGVRMQRRKGNMVQVSWISFGLVSCKPANRRTFEPSNLLSGVFPDLIPFTRSEGKPIKLIFLFLV